MKITYIGTACCIIEIGTVKILTDPVFDEAGGLYHHGFGAFSKKTEDPRLENVNLDDINFILLSHPQHQDNFDQKGREFAKTVPLIISTKKIESQYSNGKGLKPWEKFEYFDPKSNSKIKITALPARHHPNWLPEFFSGKVIGFCLESTISEETLYISGDTIFFKGIKDIAKKIKPTYSLIHVGSAQFRYLTGFGEFTMGAKGFIETVKTINSKLSIPIHTEGWSHFKESNEDIIKQLELEGSDFRKKIYFLKKGETVDLKSIIKNT